MVILFAVLLECNAALSLVIGATLPLNGPSAAIGAALRNGSALFVEMVNGAGGVDLGPAGRAPLVLDIVDDGGASDGARAGYEALLARGMSHFLGPQSGLEAAALDALAAAGRPTVAVLPISGACPWSGLLLCATPRIAAPV